MTEQLITALDRRQLLTRVMPMCSLACLCGSWVGAGDVKLLAALGAWLGPTATFWACLYGLAGGGLLAIALAVAGGAEVRRSVTTNLTTSFLTLSTPDAPRRAKSLTVPLAVPLAIAASAVFISSGGF